MKPSKRLERIPPYAFARARAQDRGQARGGGGLISLGIGDPDSADTGLVVEAMQEAVTEAETHKYPSNRGRETSRRRV